MNTLQTKFIQAKFIEEDILSLTYSNEKELDVEDVEESFSSIINFLEDKNSFKLLVEIPKGFNLSNEARLKIKSYNEQIQSKIICQATYGECYFARVLAYVYKKMYNPPYESMFFSNRDKALAWLKESKLQLAFN